MTIVSGCFGKISCIKMQQGYACKHETPDASTSALIGGQKQQTSSKGSAFTKRNIASETL